MSHSETVSDILFLTGLTTSGITGYKTLQKPPLTAGVEVELTQAVATSDGEVLMEEFVSPALGIESIPAGDFVFDIYGAVSAMDGVSELVGHVYQRTLAGGETELFSFTTGEIDATTATLYQVTYALASPVTTVITDRLVLKVYAKTSYATDITVSLFYLGEVNQSRVKLPVSLAKVTGGDMLAALYDSDYDGLTTASTDSGDGGAPSEHGHTSSTDGGFIDLDFINIDISNISNPPTESELISVLGTPDDNSKKIYISNDNADESNNYLVCSNGGHYWFTPLAKTVMATPAITVDSTTDIVGGTGDWHGRASLEKTPDGVWVLVYKSASAHAENDGALHIRFSNDEGASWSDEDKTIAGVAVTNFPMNPTGATAGQDAGEPWLMLAPNNNLILHMWRVNYGVSGNGTYQSVSSDGGTTWSESASVDFIGTTDDENIFATDDHFVYDNVIYAGIRIYDDNIQTTCKSGLASSTDNGTTWNFISDITDFVSYPTEEVGLEYLGNNNIIAILRDDGNAKTYKSSSTDMGATWSAPTDISSTFGVSGRVRVKTRSHWKYLANWWNDSVLIACGFILTTPGNPVGRRNAIWVSQDRGITWTGPLYTAAASDDGGYGDILYNTTTGQWVYISYKGSFTAASLEQYNITITGI